MTYPAYQVIMVKVPHQIFVRDVMHRNPRLLLGTIPLPFDKGTVYRALVGRRPKSRRCTLGRPQHGSGRLRRWDQVWTRTGFGRHTWNVEGRRQLELHCRWVHHLEMSDKPQSQFGWFYLERKVFRGRPDLLAWLRRRCKRSSIVGQGGCRHSGQSAEADPTWPRRTATVTEFLERTQNLSENLVVLANQSTLGGHCLKKCLPVCWVHFGQIVL